MRYRVNDTWLSYHAEGDRQYGDDSVLIESAADLSAGTPWEGEGFTICPLFSPHDYTSFSNLTRNLLLDCWRQAGLAVTDEFELHQYHQVAADAESHLAAIEKTRLLQTQVFPLGVSHIEERISAVCGRKLVARNPWDKQSIFHFRVIRPHHRDNNPLHRDVWLKDYDDCINLYIPVAGSNPLSSLIIVPGSHRWPESRVERTTSGSRINGQKFNVPAVTGIRGDYSIARPDPKENEVLIFSPYLIHGGAVNLHPDKTRISIEMRLWQL